MRASETECGREASGMRLKFVLSQLRTCTHESKNMFVFFKSLRFYGEQESVESNLEAQILEKIKTTKFEVPAEFYCYKQTWTNNQGFKTSTQKKN